MRSVLFYLPTDKLGFAPLPVFAFGAMVMLAFVVGVLIARRRAMARGLDGERTVDLCLYATVAGIVGARVTYLLFDYTPDSSSDHYLLDMIAIWKGGLTYQGGLIAGIAVVWWYMHTRYWPVGRYLDALAPAVLVGAGIGRVGCFLNGCCWGRVAHFGSAWGVTFPETSQVARYQADQALLNPSGWMESLIALGYPMPPPSPPLPVLPTQLFETAGYIAIALLLVGIERIWRRRPDGSLMLAAVALYSVFRFGVEFFRDDTPLILPLAGMPALRFGQWVALVSLAGVGLIALLMARRAERRPEGESKDADGKDGEEETPPPPVA